ncbi:hypothetical protein HYP99_gp084 [Sinorhizobium phage ort11]|uniref:Uncharacterized protein n=1 Tax=Sinorhizobium phage ort11 TaxID=2599764 RepID=A0A5C2H5N1_9CAUD|nr:hypothetical protein HYP99_gp084 [Sinorhizobium phage ort11]QEP29882.1 hypothetical protein Smphiort11_084 [Sinorhizobium phage ort11]
MGLRNPFNEPDCGASFAMTVDQLLGSAYTIVKSVADNLKYILHVSTYMNQIVELAEFRQELVSGELGALGSTTLIELPTLESGESVVNVSVNLMKTTGELYNEESSPCAVVVTGGNVSVTLDADADASFVGATAYCRLVIQKVVS